MADGLSIAAGAVQVADAGFKLYGALSQYIKDIRDANEHHKRLADELHTTAWALQQLGSLLKEADDLKLCKPEATRETNEALNGCKIAFNDVSTIITGANSASGNTSSMSIADRLKWPLKKNKVQLLLAQLERLKITLLLVFKVLSYASKIASKLLTTCDELLVQNKNDEAQVQQAACQAESRPPSLQTQSTSRDLFITEDRSVSTSDYSRAVEDNSAISGASLPDLPAVDSIGSNSLFVGMALAPNVPLQVSQKDGRHKLPVSNVTTEPTTPFSSRKQRLATQLESCIAAVSRLAAVLDQAKTKLPHDASLDVRLITRSLCKAGRTVDDLVKADLEDDSDSAMSEQPEGERLATSIGPFAGFEGLTVTAYGKVSNGGGLVVGEVTEGDYNKMQGLAVDEAGDILDRYGNKKGRTMILLRSRSHSSSLSRAQQLRDLAATATIGGLAAYDLDKKDRKNDNIIAGEDRPRRSRSRRRWARLDSYGANHDVDLPGPQVSAPDTSPSASMTPSALVSASSRSDTERNHSRSRSRSRTGVSESARIVSNSLISPGLSFLRKPEAAQKPSMTFSNDTAAKAGEANLPEPANNAVAEDSEDTPSFGLKMRRGCPAPPGGCQQCTCTESPEWRRGPNGRRTLCNACGLQYMRAVTRQQETLKEASTQTRELPVYVALASVIAAYRDAGVRVQELKQERAKKGAPALPRLLGKSIDQAQEELEREKKRGLLRFGKAFEAGDDSAVVALQQITTQLQRNLLDKLQHDDDETTDWMLLVDAADIGRDQTIAALFALRQRLVAATAVEKIATPMPVRPAAKQATMATPEYRHKTWTKEYSITRDASGNEGASKSAASADDRGHASGRKRHSSMLGFLRQYGREFGSQDQVPGIEEVKRTPTSSPTAPLLPITPERSKAHDDTWQAPVAQQWQKPNFTYQDWEDDPAQLWRGDGQKRTPETGERTDTVDSLIWRSHAHPAQPSAMRLPTTLEDGEDDSSDEEDIVVQLLKKWTTVDVNSLAYE